MMASAKRIDQPISPGSVGAGKGGRVSGGSAVMRIGVGIAAGCGLAVGGAGVAWQAAKVKASSSARRMVWVLRFGIASSVA
jgi:hypothetical protein